MVYQVLRIFLCVLVYGVHIKFGVRYQIPYLERTMGIQHGSQYFVLLSLDGLNVCCSSGASKLDSIRPYTSGDGFLDLALEPGIQSWFPADKPVEPFPDEVKLPVFVTDVCFPANRLFRCIPS